MSDSLRPLLIELRRLQRATAGSRAEVVALLADVQQLRTKLVEGRDAVGTEINTVQRGIAAFNAYGQFARALSGKVADVSGSKARPPARRS